MNTMLHQRLLRIIRQRDAKAMLETLGSLSVSDFRTASTLMREGLLGELAEEDFWTFFHTIVPANSRAYLGTFLKAAATKYAYRDITLSAEQVARFASWATDTDKRKFAQAFLPILRRPDEVSVVMDGLSLSSQAYITLLIPVRSTPVAYALFQYLRRLDHDAATIRNVCVALMRRGDDQAFALASLLGAYFDIQNLPGTFSLRVEPFQLSSISDNYDAFQKIIAP